MSLSSQMPAAGDRTGVPLRIALLDDHETLLEAMVLQLRDRDGVIVVGAWSNSAPLLAALRTEPVDIVLMDYALAADDLDCCTLIQSLLTLRPAPRILVVSAHDNPMVISAVLRSGAAGYVCKTADWEALLEAVLDVAAGGCHVSDAHLTRVEAIGKLTECELNILRHVLAGSAVSAVARHESVSEKTVSTHKRAAFRKLGLQGDADLFRFAPLVAALIAESEEPLINRPYSRQEIGHAGVNGCGMRRSPKGS